MIMLPEIIVIVTAMAALTLDLFLEDRNRRVLTYLCLAGLVAALVSLIATPMNGSMLGGRFLLDPVSWWFKALFIVAGFFTITLSRDRLDGNTAVRHRGIGFPGEYYTILLFTLVGMMYLISAT